LLNKILKYDLFFNFDKINNKFIEEYNKFNNKMDYDKLDTLKVRVYRANKEKKINVLYYESYKEKMV